MSVIFFSLDVGLSEVETADETSIPPPENESDVGGVFMVEVVLTEAADRGDFRAEADCRFDGSKTQASSRKVAMDRRRNMKEVKRSDGKGGHKINDKCERENRGKVILC